ncbi:hypothetical protein QN277_019979 [Acacia crassicarpa]|uniref:Peptidase C14 caspase domain-containing protein n=1 Tax=Acacia crassicarpa TaxID=499986 RepID=A0AAE1JKJ8_9FABA|nr:hypothetical protein QN277_019979 [Acacia crassicarpa]
MSSHKEKTNQQTQEAMFRYKKCRNQNKGEAQIICCNCKGEFHVPPTTTTYRCPRCQAITASSSRNVQSNKDRGNEMGLVKSSFPTKNIIKSDHISQNASKSEYVLNRSPRSFSLVCSFSPSGRSNKRAVLCGVTYRKKRYRLKGPVNDVANMRELLVKVFDFPTECIHELTGHGIQETDSKEDEIDAMDESICPVDFLHEGTILDNELNSILVWPLVEGVTLHVIADTCHSGTVLDLSYVYDPEKFTWKNNKPPSKEPSRKNPSGGRAICVSACQDHQMAADTSAFKGKGMNGVMTYLFTKVIKQKPDITYGGLMEQMGKEIEEIMRNNCRPSFLQHMFRPRIVQDTVISSSEEFDLFGTIFTL